MGRESACASKRGLKLSDSCYTPFDRSRHEFAELRVSKPPGRKLPLATARAGNRVVVLRGS